MRAHSWSGGRDRPTYVSWAGSEGREGLSQRTIRRKTDAGPQMTLQRHRLMRYPSPRCLRITLLIPFSLFLSAAPAFCFLKYFRPFFPHLPSCLSAFFFSHLTPQPSLLSQSSPRLEDISVSSLLCDFKFLPCPLCVSPTTSRFLPPARAPYTAWTKGTRGEGDRLEDSAWGMGPSSALCPGPPPQPQAYVGSLQQERDQLLSLSNWAGS